MKKTIFVEKMIDCNKSIAYWQDMVQEAEKAYTRKRSEKGRKEATEEINRCKNLVKNYQEKLANYEKEMQEAIALANTEKVFIYYAYNRVNMSGWQEKETVYISAKTWEEAKEKAEDMKKNQGGYIANLRVEIHNDNVVEEHTRIENEIARLQEKLKELEKRM